MNVIYLYIKVEVFKNILKYTSEALYLLLEKLLEKESETLFPSSAFYPLFSQLEEIRHSKRNSAIRR